MNLSQIEIIVEIAKAGSISQAAQNLFVSQPSVSKALQRFEEQVGAQIFERVSTGVRLTPIGRKFVEQAAAAGRSELLEHLISAPGRNREANRLYWESCDTRDYRGALERIDVPTALFFAEPGSLYSPEIARWIAERVPGATIHIFHGCTHLASGEKPLEFIQAISDFAKKAPVPAGRYGDVRREREPTC